MMKKGSLSTEHKGSISTLSCEFTGNNNEAVVFIKAFLTFSPIKSCLENSPILRQRTESVLVVESITG